MQIQTPIVLCSPLTDIDIAYLNDQNGFIRGQMLVIDLAPIASNSIISVLRGCNPDTPKYRITIQKHTFHSEALQKLITIANLPDIPPPQIFRASTPVRDSIRNISLTCTKWTKDQ